MKKYIFMLSLVIFSALLFVFPNLTKAESLNAKFGLDKITSIEGGHSLDYYILKEPDRVKKSLNKVKIRHIGKTYVDYLCNGAQIRFRKKILSRKLNTGYKPISYEFSSVEESSDKLIFGVSGQKNQTTSLGFNIPGATKGTLKKEMTSKLNVDYKREQTIKTEKKEKISFDIEPGVVVIHSVDGTGALFSGSISKYIMWYEVDYGTFEILRVDSLFESIEKVRVQI